MTFDEFMEKLLSAFPEATVGEDNDGQLIIYTNLKQGHDLLVVSMGDTGDTDRT